jgi:hypothetical protein
MKREVGEMERSNLMQPGAGHPIGGGTGGIVLKVGADDSNHMSVFEITVAPGFDVGAHVHTAIEESFYVLEGSLNLQVGDETGNGIQSRNPERGRGGCCLFCCCWSVARSAWYPVPCLG